MPIPQPKKNESKNDFVSRCFTDPIMEGDFPNKNQRLAVCNQTFRDKKKKK